MAKTTKAAPKKRAAKKQKPAVPKTEALTPEQEQELTYTGEGPDWRNAEQLAQEQIVLSTLETDPLIRTLTSHTEDELATANMAVKIEATTRMSLSDETRGYTSCSSLRSILPRNEDNRLRVLQQCLYLYYKNPLARNIIRAYVYLTLGTGMKVTFPEDTPKETLERWETIKKNNDWDVRVKNIITMTYLLGEQFVLRHPLQGAKGWDNKKGRVDQEELNQLVSEIPAEDVLLTNISPNEIIKIRMSDKNREIPYFYVVDDGIKEAAKLDDDRGFYSTDITHFRIDDLGVTTRGRPILEPVLKYLSYYSMFLLDRLTMSAIRTRIPIIRKMKGLTRGQAMTNMRSHGLPHPGTVACVPLEEVWETPGGPTDGTTAEVDGRSILLQIASGVSLPEFLVTQDASNSNLASTLSASAPLVPMIQDYRTVYKESFEDEIEEVTGVRPVCSFPSIIRDEIKNLVEAMSKLRADKVLSKKTYQVKVGLDPDIEAQQLEEELLEDADNMINDDSPEDDDVTLPVDDDEESEMDDDESEDE